jgi:hypothetical protein|tara:strand:+ start:312 stop:836 length:525 start_codon:yes stop_codon:yes gene_type:complete
MIRTVDFVMDFDPANPPKRMKTGGVRTTPVAASKALEMRGVKTEAIKDLETPPPVSINDTKVNEPIITYQGSTRMSDTPDVFYPQLEMEQGLRPQDDFFQRYQMIKGAPGARQMFEMQQPKGKVITPNELKMILDAQQNMGGIMASNMTGSMEPKTGLAALSEITYGDGGTIKV